MAVRPNMQYLIDFVKEQIHDTDNTQYTDQQIQDRLDMGRLDLYNHKLRAGETLNSSGQIEWRDFYSQYSFWEEDPVLQKPNGTVVTPDTAEPFIGRWTFEISQDFLPLGATGRVYNVYGACAKLLFQWENTIRSQFNFTVDGLTVQRIAQIKDLHALAMTFQAQAWGGPGTTIRMVRKDLRG